MTVADRRQMVKGIIHAIEYVHLLNADLASGSLPLTRAENKLTMLRVLL